MTQREREKEKRKKKQTSILEAQILRIMEQNMKKALDMALDEVFKGWK